MSHDDTMTVPEVVRLLGVTRQAVYNKIYLGQLTVVPAAERGNRRSLRVTRESVERWIERRRMRHAGAK